MRILFVAVWALAFLSGTVAFATQESPTPENPAEKGIEDNSFLLEEAYNQEPGVVQFIQSFQYQKESKQWSYRFTNEFPVGGQSHQLSYELALQKGAEKVQLGDIRLNYRYELYRSEDDRAVLTPRFSLLLPTGKHEEGAGNGALGYELALATSLNLSPTWVSHLNVGTTLVPGAQGTSGGSADKLDVSYGASLIYLATPTLNLMLELLGTSSVEVQPDNGPERSGDFTISPGARFAINLPNDVQIVPGLAFPITLSSGPTEVAAFLYLSVEPKLW